MKLLNDYKEAREKIFTYFGGEDHWPDLPIVDCKNFYWKIIDGMIVASEDIVHAMNESSECVFYVTLFTKSRNIRIGAEYTMICGTDGNGRWLVLANDKRLYT